MKACPSWFFSIYVVATKPRNAQRKHLSWFGLQLEGKKVKTPVIKRTWNWARVAFTLHGRLWLDQYGAGARVQCVDARWANP